MINDRNYFMGGGDTSHNKSEKRRLSTEKARRDDKPKDNKQKHDYSKLEGGERARISPEDLGELIAEADTEKLEQYGGVKVCLHFTFTTPTCIKPQIGCCRGFKHRPRKGFIRK